MVSTHDVPLPNAKTWFVRRLASNFDAVARSPAHHRPASAFPLVASRRRDLARLSTRA
jgi:hypothetical protein